MESCLSLKDFDKFLRDRQYALALNKPEGWELRIDELKLFRLMVKDKSRRGF